MPYDPLTYAGGLVQPTPPWLAWILKGKTWQTVGGGHFKRDVEMILHTRSEGKPGLVLPRGQHPGDQAR